MPLHMSYEYQLLLFLKDPVMGCGVNFACTFFDFVNITYVKRHYLIKFNKYVLLVLSLNINSQLIHYHYTVFYCSDMHNYIAVWIRMLPTNLLRSLFPFFEKFTNSHLTIYLSICNILPIKMSCSIVMRICIILFLLSLKIHVFCQMSI